MRSTPSSNKVDIGLLGSSNERENIRESCVPISGRTIRDIERKLPQPDAEMAELLSRAKQIEQQKKSDSNKLYSMHAPEVKCIAKGKVHKRYEFGCKVVLVTTSASNWIVGTDAVYGNSYDGATLSGVVEQTNQLMVVAPRQAVRRY